MRGFLTSSFYLMETREPGQVVYIRNTGAGAWGGGRGQRGSPFRFLHVPQSRKPWRVGAMRDDGRWVK
jgi:hypothetical protein